jgi:hypothetical protein
MRCAAGSWRRSRIGQVDRQAGWNQHGLAGFDHHRRIDAGAQVQSPA